MKGKSIEENYNHTIYASYIGYITQAIVNNFVPLLFLTFRNTLHIPLSKIGLLVTINFSIQLLIDFLSAKYVDKIGYRKSAVGAHVFAAAGLIGLAIFPSIFKSSYAGIVFAVVLYAIGGGAIEVLVSPIVEACPTERKEAAMSLLHSFYCWGQVFVILFSTLFFSIFGIKNWRILSCIWSIVPLLNSIYFSKVPIAVLVDESERLPIFDLVKNKLFWLFIIFMICAGASEQAMSQWASAFAESGLKVSKTIGDLAGPCLFAVLMGCSRASYAKFSVKMNLHKFMFASSILCVISYLIASLSHNPAAGLIGVGVTGLSVGILWPGTFSIASKGIPKGGTAMFALLALAGDLGCSAGPTVVATASEAFNENLKIGILSAIIFPICLLIALSLYQSIKKQPQM